jgi:hypothetical protein
MRIAITSDIHGNRAAFEAVLGDLRETAPERSALIRVDPRPILLSGKIMGHR